MVVGPVLARVAPPRRVPDIAEQFAGAGVAVAGIFGEGLGENFGALRRGVGVEFARIGNEGGAMCENITWMELAASKGGLPVSMAK